MSFILSYSKLFASSDITDSEVNNETKANETKSEEPKTENKPDAKIDNKTEGTSNGALKNKPLKVSNVITSESVNGLNPI